MLKKDIKQIYTPYWSWECYKNLMWERIDNEDELLKQAIIFTSNHLKYGAAMSEVINVWKNTMLNHLTNLSINRKAFLGHCAVSFKLNIPEYITRTAWKHLTEQQRIDANYQAEQNIKKWELNLKLKNILKRGKIDVINQEYQMKLQFP